MSWSKSVTVWQSKNKIYLQKLAGPSIHKQVPCMMILGRDQPGIWVGPFYLLLDFLLLASQVNPKGNVSLKVASEGMLMLTFPSPCFPCPLLFLKSTLDYYPQQTPSLMYLCLQVKQILQLHCHQPQYIPSSCKHVALFLQSQLFNHSCPSVLL